MNEIQPGIGGPRAHSDTLKVYKQQSILIKNNEEKSYNFSHYFNLMAS